MHEELGFVAEAQDAPDEYETVGVEELQPQEDMVADDTGHFPVAQYIKRPTRVRIVERRGGHCLKVKTATQP